MKKRIVSALLVLVLFSLTGCKVNDYNNAVALYEEGKYQEASAAFTELGDYLDAQKKAQDAQLALDYAAALVLYEKEDYEQAIEAFTALGDYQDSQEYIEKAQNPQLAPAYDAAVALYEAEDYEQAFEAFTALGSFLDSKIYIANMGFEKFIEWFSISSKREIEGGLITLGVTSYASEQIIEAMQNKGLSISSTLYIGDSAYQSISVAPTFRGSMDFDGSHIVEHVSNFTFDYGDVNAADYDYLTVTLTSGDEVFMELMYTPYYREPNGYFSGTVIFSPPRPYT
jgi:tetratricopeptide (TPR) repeat protein